MYSIKKSLLFVLLISALVAPTVSAERNDIRYRSIVYFNPDGKIITKAELSNLLGGFAVVDELPDSVSEAYVAYSIISDFNDSYPVPDNQYLSYFGRGIDKNQVNSIRKSKHALLVDIAYPLDMSLKGIRPVSNLLYEIASSYGGLIWDSETREMFAPETWKEKRIDSWDSDIPVVENYTVIHAYKSQDGVRAITLGMAKFGFPDIVVNNFSWSLNKSMGNLVNLVAQTIVEGNGIDSQGILKLEIEKLKDTAYKRDLVATLKDNAVSDLEIEIGGGKWEEGDPNNYLIELMFSRSKGKSLSEKHDHFLSSIFGWEDSISYVDHDSLILEASERAKKKLNGLRKDFNSGLNPGEFIQVKAPFKTPDGGNEWMWVEVIAWKGSSIKGLLKNEPYNVPDLKGGSEVTVDQSIIFDYIRNYVDGKSEGNETGKLIMKYQENSS